MTDSSDRRFSDEEVALILRRAAELEGGQTQSGGLTLAEIRRVAQEAGIHPDLVERAAAMLQHQRRGAADRVFGGASLYLVEQDAPGELPRAAFGDVADAIRRVMGDDGQTKEVLDALEWKSVGTPTVMTVTVRPHDGRTSVRVSANRGVSGMLTYVMSGTGGLLAGAITGAILEPGVAGGLAIMGSAIGAGFLTARTIWSRATARFNDRFARLLDALGSAVRSNSVAPEPRDGSTPDPP